jgi:hypothetical protein
VVCRDVPPAASWSEQPSCQGHGKARPLMAQILAARGGSGTGSDSMTRCLARGRLVISATVSCHMRHCLTYVRLSISPEMTDCPSGGQDMCSAGLPTCQCHTACAYSGTAPGSIPRLAWLLLPLASAVSGRSLPLRGRGFRAAISAGATVSAQGAALSSRHAA